MMAGNTCPLTPCREYPESVAALDGGTRLISSFRTSSAIKVPYTNAAPDIASCNRPGSEGCLKQEAPDAVQVCWCSGEPSTA